MRTGTEDLIRLPRRYSTKRSPKQRPGFTFANIWKGRWCRRWDRLRHWCSLWNVAIFWSVPWGLWWRRGRIKGTVETTRATTREGLSWHEEQNSNREIGFMRFLSRRRAKERGSGEDGSGVGSRHENGQIGLDHVGDTANERVKGCHNGNAEIQFLLDEVGVEGWLEEMEWVKQ